MSISKKYVPLPGHSADESDISRAIGERVVIHEYPLVNGIQEYKHNLGFTPRGRIVVKASSDVSIGDDYITKEYWRFTASVHSLSTNDKSFIHVIWVP